MRLSSPAVNVLQFVVQEILHTPAFEDAHAVQIPLLFILLADDSKASLWLKSDGTSRRLAQLTADVIEI